MTISKCQTADLNLEMLNVSQVKPGNATTLIQPIHGGLDLPCLHLPWLTLSTFRAPPKVEYTKEDKQTIPIKVRIK